MTEPLFRKQNQTSPVILLSLVVLGLILGGFYYFQNLRDQVLEIPRPNIPAEDKLTQFNSLMLDFSIFDNERFQSLKIFGETPVRPSNIGRDNPFAPY